MYHCAKEKEVNGRLDTVTTTKERVYRILDSMFKLVFFQMTKPALSRARCLILSG